MTILERIKLNSAKHPERVVMRTQYGFGEMTMKWGELDAFSDKLAYYLTKELRTNKPIIVYGHKHPMMLATVYKGNIIKNLIMDCQSYTKYRPNETTGGIFVSWRRKEELPTGA